MKIPKYWFSYRDWRDSRMHGQPHRRIGAGDVWDPPLPDPIPHKGYATLRVDVGQFHFAFTTPAQLNYFIEVMGEKQLLRSKRWAAQNGIDSCLNTHWLSRLPAGLKTPRMREKVVRTLRAIYPLVTLDGRNFIVEPSLTGEID